MSTFVPKNSYNEEDIVACTQGQLFGIGNCRLPSPNMLMVDRITEITSNGGEFSKGSVVAELDIKPDLWFFDCHFPDDPVMPGCLGLDGLWQLIGFYLAWRGNQGRGRALGAGEVKFFGQVLPTAKRVTYRIDISRIVERKLIMAIGNGAIYVDDRQIYTARELRVGLFSSTDNF